MDRTPTPELIDEVAGLRDFFGGNLYGPVELSSEANLAIYSLLILAVDRLGEAARIEQEIDALKVDLACLEAVARDLDVIDRASAPRPVGAHGFMPRRAEPARPVATVLPFRRPSLPPRALFVPAGPGGAA